MKHRISMTDTEKVLLFTKVLNAWGVDSQVRMVMEESGEMLAALGKAGKMAAMRKIWDERKKINFQ